MYNIIDTLYIYYPHSLDGSTCFVFIFSYFEVGQEVVTQRDIRA